MPICLYGLILSRNAGRVPAGAGCPTRVALRVVPCDALSAIVGGVEGPPSRTDRQAVVHHDVVLTDVVRHGVTVLSSRFGQTFADERALCADLAAAPNHARLLATLERYDGLGEMRIIMRDGIDPPADMRASTAPPDSPGRAYLETLREKLMPRPPIDFRAVVGDIIREERVERRGDTRIVSHLVAFADEPRYRAELYTHPALAGATIMGPHALYTFAEPAA